MTSPVEKRKRVPRWDFSGVRTREYTHGLHQYPAMMIPQVARELIGMICPSAKSLFDPFCGTGTTLVEGKLVGLPSYGTDINPLARFIANTKTAHYNVEQLTKGKKILSELVRNTLNMGKSEEIESLLDGDRKKWESWFPEESLAEISHLSWAIDELGDFEGTDLFRCVLSNSLRRVSYQRDREFKLYRIAAEDRGDFSKELWPVFRKGLEDSISGINRYQKKQTGVVESEVYSFNTVTSLGQEHHGRSGRWIDAVVTSPPYGDSATTVAYAQYSWLSNMILGLDERVAGALDREMMGGTKSDVVKTGCAELDIAIEDINKVDSSRAKEVMGFYLDYKKSIDNVCQMTKDKSFSGYVVGNRMVRGTVLPTDVFTAWCFEENGFVHQETIVRNFPMKRMPYETSPSNKEGGGSPTMKSEYIVICEKSV